ncbi:MAG: hypothetical protein KDD92_19055, partial [Caldilineaceae bacterium]|nr:hypothetical protein [Caldilineaceae bacterium]
MMPNPAVSPARDGAGNLLAREWKNAPDRADCLSLPLEGEPGFAWFAGAGELAAGNAEIVNPAPVAQIGSAPCNLQAPWVNNATFDSISATVIDDVVSLGCLVGSNVSNIGNLSNGDTTDSATFQMTGLNCDATLSVEDTNDTYPAGTYAGFKVSSDSLLDVSVGFDVTIETWNGGALQESQTVVSSLVGVDASLLDGSGDVVLGFVTAQDFDEVRIVYEAAVGVLVTGEVYYAVVEPFCAGDPLPCNMTTSMTAPDYPVVIDSEHTGVGAAACIGCSVTGVEKVINDDETDAAAIVLTAGVLDASGSIAVQDLLTDYAAGTFAGFEIENTGLLDLSLLQGITVETFLAGVPKESVTGSGSLLTVATSLLSGGGRMTVGFITTQSFDEVKLTVSNPVLGVDLGSTLVYRALFKSLCELNLSCDQTYYLSEPDFPVIIDSGLTGVEGVACVGCAVDDSAAVISSDQNDFATITMPAGVAASGSIAVFDPIETFPEGSTAGFTIRDANGLLEADLLDSLTVCTYNDGGEQECSEGGDLLNVSLLLNWGATAGLQDVGFKTTLPFDEIRITVDPLVNAGLGDNEIEVYSAFLDTRTATGGDLFCRDTDGDGIRDNVDADDDDDGIPDIQEGDGAVDTDSDGMPDSLDLDSDNDGLNDVDEGGDGGLDANNDGRINSADVGFADGDSDGQADASVDVNEEPNSDGDGVPDYRDLDSDNDGINDVAEAGYGAFDGDNDGMVDVSGTNDSDGDGIQDGVDGAPGVFGDAADPAPLDTDGDGIPDYRDQDGDNDGIPDSEEGSGNVDTDGDGVPNSRDLDSDNDGVNDVDEGGDGALDTNDDGQINSDDTGFADDNGDGQADASVDAEEEPDGDGDSVPDYRDLDS